MGNVMSLTAPKRASGPVQLPSEVRSLLRQPSQSTLTSCVYDNTFALVNWGPIGQEAVMPVLRRRGRSSW